MRKMAAHFYGLQTNGPVLVETGANTPWPEGIEVATLKKAIQKVYSRYANAILFVYSVKDEENPREVREFCWDEFVAHGTEMPTVSRADLLPPATPTSPQQDLASGVTIPPMPTFSVQIQETMQREPVAVPSPAYSESEPTVRVFRLKKCLLSHQAMPGSSKQEMTVRLYRNDNNHCYGEPLCGNDPVYHTTWYMALLRTTTEPIFKADPQEGTPGGSRRAWRTWAAEDTMDGPQ